MCNCTELQNRLKKSSKVSIKRKMRKTRRGSRTRLSSLRKTLKRESGPSMKPDSSSRKRSKKRRWKANSWRLRLVNCKVTLTNVSRS